MKKLTIHGKKEVLKQSRLKQLNKAINLRGALVYQNRSSNTYWHGDAIWTLWVAHL